MRKLGWIGLGKMGLPMATKIVEENYHLSVFNRTYEKALELEDLGASSQESPAEVASRSESIITMVSDDNALKKVALGNTGLLAGAQPNSTLIDMSTVSPGLSSKIAELTHERNINYLRAPVNGTVMQAENSTLVIIVSGPKKIFEKHEPIFELMGNKIFYVGDEEQARYLKLVINMMVGISSIMTAEALALGKAGGLDWHLMIDIIKNSAVGSPLIQYKENTLKNRDYTPAFSVIQMAKDFDLILDAGKANNVPLSMAAQTRQNWSSMIATGRGEKDYFAYLELIEELSGLK